MIKQVFHVKSYWKVIAYYDVGYNFFHPVALTLKRYGASDDMVDEVVRMLHTRKAKAFTFSNTLYHVSIIVFGHHFSKPDYLNSIIHEAEHVKQAMLKAYSVEDMGEPPAYTIGFLASRMYEVLRYLLCDCKPS